MRCATHPGVETELRCATCGVPICPDCLVQTPVGMKCREHGLAPLPPQFRLTPAGVAAAVPAILVLSAVTGFVALQIPFFLAWLAVGFFGGRLIAEAAWYTAGRKRGPRLAALTAATILVGGTVGTLYLVTLAAGGAPALDRLLSRTLSLPQTWIVAVIAAIAAYGRLR